MKILAFLLTAVFGLRAFCCPAPASASPVVHERRDSTPPRWVKSRRVTPGSQHVVRIGLTQRNLHRAHQFLMDVAHPESLNYGKHWTAQEVLDTFAPSDETIATVRQWLNGAGIANSRILSTNNKGWLVFVANATELESLVHTKYYEYRDTVSGKQAVSCDQYFVPENIRRHVDYINPGVLLSVPNRQRTYDGQMELYRPRERYALERNATSNLKSCDIRITPQCIAALYQIPPATNVYPNNSLGIFEEGNYYSQEDLNLFFQNLTANRIPQGIHPIPAFIDGAQAPVPVFRAGAESDLDLQMAYPIVYPQTITLYQTDDFNYARKISYFSGLFNSFLDAIDGSYCTYCAFGQCGNDPALDPIYPDQLPGGYNGTLMCGMFKPTNVISLSYGTQEGNLPVPYQRRQCNEYLKLGLQGVSLFFSSGDNGVAAPRGINHPNGCLGPEGKIFNPRFPNNCPYVTNVGGTKVYPGRTVFEPESAVNDPAGHPYPTNFSSGGGFSNLYPVPDYQADAVAEYFRAHNPPYPYYEGNASLGANGGLYNRSGRGYPDVAANGDNMAIFWQGAIAISGGTSASAPIFASIINRINDHRLANGKRPVGFVNAVLYSNPQVLNDVTNGSNPGCGTNGFSASPGWDPVTGLGTPSYPKMLELFMNLP